MVVSWLLYSHSGNIFSCRPTPVNHLSSWLVNDQEETSTLVKMSHLPLDNHVIDNFLCTCRNVIPPWLGLQSSFVWKRLHYCEGEVGTWKGAVKDGLNFTIPGKENPSRGPFGPLRTIRQLFDWDLVDPTIKFTWQSNQLQEVQLNDVSPWISGGFFLISS